MRKEELGKKRLAVVFGRLGKTENSRWTDLGQNSGKNDQKSHVSGKL
jgi:hypothetical protein